MPRKIPMRRCVATSEQCAKKDLLRIVRTPEGNLAVEAAKKNGALKRALKMDIPDSFYEEIKKAI